MGDFIVDTVQKYLEGMLPEMGLEVFDIQFRQEGHGWVLRVFIDTPVSDENVSLDQCGKVSRELGQYLDVEDCISHAYHLEISSPGLERPLRSLADFSRFVGKKCKIRLHEALDGEKVYVGEIAGVKEDCITLVLPQKELQVRWGMLNKARLFFE